MCLHFHTALLGVVLLLLSSSPQVSAFRGPSTVFRIRQNSYVVDHRIPTYYFDSAERSFAHSRSSRRKRGAKHVAGRLVIAANGSSNDDDDDNIDEKDIMERLKSFAKSFRGESNRPNGSTNVSEKDLVDRMKYNLKSFRRKAKNLVSSTTRDASGDVESMREKVTSYVKYPYRYLRHYFAREKQEEIDGLGDILVSDETVDQEEGVDSAVEDVSVANTSVVLADVEKPSSTASSTMKEKLQTKTATRAEPQGDRWAVSAPDIDLSGNWTIITTDEFKKDYDRYLALLEQPFIVRSVALSIVGLTTEETIQSDSGRTLHIRGENARGIWERTLSASGANENNGEFTSFRTPILTIDKEKVEAEAWWEEKGTVHRSWLRGVTKYGGGDFESKRYLEQDGKIFVCDTVFHPIDETREKARVTWRFLRKGETLESD